MHFPNAIDRLLAVVVVVVVVVGLMQQHAEVVRMI